MNKLPVKAERLMEPSVWFDDLRNDFEQFWEKPWKAFGRKFKDMETMPWTPKVDVFRKDNELVVKADLPGMKKENVHVVLEEGDLILKGERKEEKEYKEEDVFRAERIYGSFFRRLPLDFEVDPMKVNAKFNDGVLEIRLPMPPPEEPKAAPITIQ
ncbi:MAG TPA: Hsp20/alpha crystallin family protein [Thermoanaerobaculia bacterium]